MPELKKAPAGMTARNTSNRIFNLVKRNPQGGYPATADIPEEDEVYMEWTDKKSGEEKSGLRHIRFAIGESSIYVDEQSDKAETRRGKIKFTDGLLTVNEMEKTKIEFLEVCNYNKSNHESGTAMVGKSALFRSDASKHEARLRLNKRHQKQKLNNIVANYSIEEIEGICLALQVPINVNDEESVMLAKDRFGRMIDYNADRFEQEVNSEMLRMKTVLHYALRDNIISFDRAGSEWYFEIGGKRRILSVPRSSDKFEFFAEMVTVKQDIREIFNDIKGLVEDGRKPSNKKLNPNTKSYKLVNEGMELKVIKNNLGTLVANNIGQLGEPDSGIEGAVHHLMEDKGTMKAVEELIALAKEDSKKKK
tara:strand:- start:476 stop:1567 length:1092 start_codon:yes stop_codon:yes gene_type:complete